MHSEIYIFLHQDNRFGTFENETSLVLAKLSVLQHWPWKTA